MDSVNSDVARFACAKCDGPLKVINSRCRDGMVRVRRYRCKNCRWKRTSVEIMLDNEIAPGGAGMEKATIAVQSKILRGVSDTRLVAELQRRIGKNS
jgi:hypothetical protein